MKIIATLASFTLVMCCNCMSADIGALPSTFENKQQEIEKQVSDLEEDNSTLMQTRDDYQGLKKTLTGPFASRFTSEQKNKLFDSKYAQHSEVLSKLGINKEENNVQIIINKIDKELATIRKQQDNCKQLLEELKLSQKKIERRSYLKSRLALPEEPTPTLEEEKSWGKSNSKFGEDIRYLETFKGDLISSSLGFITYEDDRERSIEERYSDLSLATDYLLWKLDEFGKVYMGIILNPSRRNFIEQNLEKLKTDITNFVVQIKQNIADGSIDNYIKLDEKFRLLVDVSEFFFDQIIEGEGRDMLAQHES